MAATERSSWMPRSASATGSEGSPAASTVTAKRPRAVSMISSRPASPSQAIESGVAAAEPS